MSQKFIEKGYKIGTLEEKADICIVNTCTVTNMSDRKSRQILRRVKELNPSAIIVATGCYVQVSSDEVTKIPEIDICVGNNEKADIVQIIEDYMCQKKGLLVDTINYSCITDVMYKKEFVDFGQITYTEKTRATIKVQDGCDRFCSYCIIPYARGRVRSRKKESILKEVEKIATSGIKEIVITGIHISSYGKDFTDEYKLIDLLEDLNKIQGIERIRLGSLEPTIITEEFVTRLKKLKKICDQFHLSLQSGCDETLKRMNRRYTTEEFKKIVNILRSSYSNVHLTTDIIVGFPGETEKEFEMTYEFLKSINFYKMHIFKYSKRKGTKAAVMPNQVEGNIQEARSKKLIELSNENEIEYNKKYIGKDVEVLFEESDGKYIKGHTKNYMIVKVIDTKEIKIENTIQKVQINSLESNNEQELLGTLKM